MKSEEEANIVVIASDLHAKATLESLLSSFGYQLEVYDSFPTEAEIEAQTNLPDVVLMEVDQATFDQAEAVATAYTKFQKTPIIYIGDSNEEGFFNKLKETKPFGFLLKPIDLGQVKRMVELAIGYDTRDGFSTSRKQGNSLTPNDYQLNSKPFFFTKVGNKLKRIDQDNVLYIEVEGKYSSIQLSERKYHVKASLKDLIQKFPSNQFLRVSRNFVVNLDRIEHIDVSQLVVKIDQRDIPISRTYKEELMHHIQLL